MGEKEAYHTRKEAVRALAEHPERRPTHDEAIRIYLAGITYAESHPRPAPRAPAQHPDVREPVRRPAAEADEPCQPVDEPAPHGPAVTRW
jgi:hypothetical protein